MFRYQIRDAPVRTLEAFIASATDRRPLPRRLSMLPRRQKKERRECVPFSDWRHSRSNSIEVFNASVTDISPLSQSSDHTGHRDRRGRGEDLSRHQIGYARIRTHGGSRRTSSDKVLTTQPRRWKRGKRKFTTGIGLLTQS